MQPLKIGVIGAGLMGHGIAYLLAAAGHTVGIYDPSAEWRHSLPSRLKASLDLLGDDPALLGRISAHDQMKAAMQDAAFVFEAAPEKLPLKQQIFAELEAIVAPTAILASNSSAIPSTDIGAKLKHRDRVVGTHFWNPPHLVPLVEVTQNEKTSADTVQKTIALLRDAGRNPVHIKKDIPGFVGNRLQHALKREAIALVAAGVCDADTIDEVVKSGFGARMAVLGPMEQSDLVGTDLTLDIQNVLVADLDRSAAPTRFLKDMVASGKLGMRTGQGFRKWGTGRGRRGARAAAQFSCRASQAETRQQIEVPVLGVVFALLSAATFALNNAAARRGVVTGTPSQGMAITVPLGVVCFLAVAIVSGEIFRLTQFPLAAAAWMAGVGLLHFIFGRYCNYRANREAGVNLTAPVVQLQVIVTLVLAVLILREPCTVLQAIGGFFILSGSFITQRQPVRVTSAPAGAAVTETDKPKFKPHYLAGYVFATGAALGYGTSPILARFALAESGPTGGILGGLIAYTAATAFVAVMMLWPPLRANVIALKRENLPWFIASGVFVAMAQGFFYSAVAVAPIMLVMPILQLSLVFRLIFAMWLTPDHEVFGPLVILGAAISIAGSLTVAIDTDVIVHALALPDAVASLLRVRLS